MASKTKAGKKQPPKAGKKQQTTKAGKKQAGKKQGTKAKRSRPDPTEQHSPIIITDGSASIQFGPREYPDPASGTHIRRSRGLRLDRIRANRRHDNGEFLCYQLGDDERVVIEVTCEMDGVNDGRGCTVTGGNSRTGRFSPTIEFDHGVYNETFPTIGLRRGRRRGNRRRDITSLKIFSVTGSGALEEVHDCDVVQERRFRISAHDLHVL